MRFLSALLLGPTLVASAIAQSSTSSSSSSSSSPPKFNPLPKSIAAGFPTILTWTGGDGSQPVTISLVQGDTNSGATTIQILTASQTGKSYTWTPGFNLYSAPDYSLSIIQGNGYPQYSSSFALTGASANPSSSVSSSSSSMTSMPAGGAAGTNGTTTNSTMANSTMTGNSTVSNMTMTGNPTTTSSSTDSTTSDAGAASTTGPTTTMGGSTAAATSARPTSSSAALAKKVGEDVLQSPLALIFGVFAAMVYIA